MRGCVIMCSSVCPGRWVDILIMLTVLLDPVAGFPKRDVVFKNEEFHVCAALFRETFATVHSRRCSVGETDATSLSLYLSFSKGRLWLHVSGACYCHFIIFILVLYKQWRGKPRRGEKLSWAARAESSNETSVSVTDVTCGSQRIPVRVDTNCILFLT